MVESTESELQPAPSGAEKRVRELEDALISLAERLALVAAERDQLRKLKHDWEARAKANEERADQLAVELADLRGRAQVLDAIVDRQEILGPYAHRLRGTYENSLRALRAHDEGRDVSLDSITGHWDIAALTEGEGLDG